MIDEKDIMAYRSIKAPSELKSRILADCEAETGAKRTIGGAFSNRAFVRSLSALAACLVLAVGIFSLTRMNSSYVTISYEGNVLSEEQLVLGNPGTAMARMLPESNAMVGIPLEIEVRRDAVITVSGGTLYDESEDGEAVSKGSRMEIENDSKIWWVIDGEAQYELKVNADGKETVYILQINDITPNGVIYKK